MDKLLHALAVLAATLSHAHLGTPTAARQYDAGLATYGGVSAWWGETGTKGVAHLMVRTRQGKVMALAPTLSADATTVDVGRGPDGAVWITYARCPARMASCRAYAYNMKTHREQSLATLGQAVAVAVDGTQVAWFREPRENSELLVGTLAGGARTARQVALAEIDDEPVAQPLALDLRGGRLAYAANQGGDDIRSEALRAGTPRHMVSIAEDGGYGEECTRLETSPTITPTALVWLRTTAGTSSCGHRVGTLIRRRWAGGALEHAAVRAQVPQEAVVTGSRVLVLAPSRVDHDQGDRGACNAYEMIEAEVEGEANGPVGCTARLLPAPRWLPGRGS